MMMTNKEINQQLVNKTARVEQLIHLGGMMTDTCSLPSDIETLIEDSPFADIEQLFGVNADVAEECFNDEGDDGLREMIVEHLHSRGRLGFLVQMATPKMRKMERGRSFSWGCYMTKWVYGETLEEACKEGLVWVDDCRAKEDSEFDKNKKEG